MQAAKSPMTKPTTAVLREGKLNSVIKEISDITALTPPSGMASQFNQPKQGIRPTHIRHRAIVDIVCPVAARPLLAAGGAGGG